MAAIIVFGSGPASRRTPVFQVPPIYRVLENEHYAAQKTRNRTPPPPRGVMKKSAKQNDVNANGDNEEEPLNQPRATRVTFFEQPEHEQPQVSNDATSARPTKSSQIRTVFRHSLVDNNEFSQEREKRRRERQLTVSSVTQLVDGRRSRMACPDDPKMEAELYSFMVGSRYTDAHVYDKLARDQNVVLYKHDYKRRYNEHLLLRDSNQELAQTIRAQTARQRREVVRTVRSPLPKAQTNEQTASKVYSSSDTEDVEEVTDSQLTPRNKQSRVPSTNRWVPPIVERATASAEAKAKKRKGAVLPSIRGLSVKDAMSINFFQRQIAQQLFGQVSNAEPKQKPVSRAESIKRILHLEEQILKRSNEQPRPAPTLAATNTSMPTTTPATERHEATDTRRVESPSTYTEEDALPERPPTPSHRPDEDEVLVIDENNESSSSSGGSTKAAHNSGREVNSATVLESDADKKLVKVLTIEIPGLPGAD